MLTDFGQCFAVGSGQRRESRWRSLTTGVGPVRVAKELLNIYNTKEENRQVQKRNKISYMRGFQSDL